MDKWWVPGLNIGFEHSFTHGVADFLASVDSDKKAQPDCKPRKTRPEMDLVPGVGLEPTT